MARSISGPLPFSPKVALAKANKAAERLGVHFDGDEENGEFHGAGFRGHYEFVDDTITLTVTDKPLIMPWSMVERAMTQMFEIQHAKYSNTKD